MPVKRVCWMLQLLINRWARITNPRQRGDYKKFTSKAVIKSIIDNNLESRKEWLMNQFITPEGNRFWRADNKPLELWSNAVIDQKIDYIHQNPVEEGWVFRAEDYVYSSAINYAGEKGLLDVTVVD